MITITPKEQSILKLLAEYQLLLTHQIAILGATGLRAAQKKMLILDQKRMVNIYHRPLNGNQGRPDKIYTISQRGLNYLKEVGIIDKAISLNNISTKESSNLEHEILINWFRIHLQYIDKCLSDLETEFISASSLFLPSKNNGQPLIAEEVEIDDYNEEFIPDGVFSILNKKQNKHLLFFLEVDMSTEAIKSPNHSTTTIAQKIVNYKSYFSSQQYKRYEKKWNCEFNGFRCLVLTNTHTRKELIANYLIDLQNVDFVWIADQDQMFNQGISSKMWIKGGYLLKPLKSIIGSTFAFEKPLI